MEFKKHKALNNYVNNKGGIFKIKVKGRVYQATPFPMGLELQTGNLVVFETGQMNVRNSDIGCIGKRLYTQGRLLFNINLIPPKEGGTSYTVGNVPFNKISHLLRLSTS